MCLINSVNVNVNLYNFINFLIKLYDAYCVKGPGRIPSEITEGSERIANQLNT